MNHRGFHAKQVSAELYVRGASSQHLLTSKGLLLNTDRQPLTPTPSYVITYVSWLAEKSIQGCAGCECVDPATEVPQSESRRGVAASGVTLTTGSHGDLLAERYRRPIYPEHGLHFTRWQHSSLSALGLPLFPMRLSGDVCDHLIPRLLFDSLSVDISPQKTAPQEKATSGISQKCLLYSIDGCVNMKHVSARGEVARARRA